jgi:integrase
MKKSRQWNLWVQGRSSGLDSAAGDAPPCLRSFDVIVIGDTAHSPIHREATGALIERALRLYINPAIGDMALAAVRPKHVQRMLNEWVETLSPSTAELYYGYVASIYKTAVREPVIGRSPCVGIRMPTKETKKIKPLDAEAVRGLALALPGRYRAIVLTAAGTGLRPSEVLGLETDCIDFERKTLQVRQQLVTSTQDGHVAYLAPPKTRQSVRTIPLSQGVMDTLTAHLADFPTVEVQIEDRTDPREPKIRKARLLFTTRRLSAIKRQTWGEIWRPAAQAIGLPPGTGLHICRHTYASALIRFGESVKTVQMLLGHKTPTITLNVYSHLWPDSDDRARQAVEAMFADVPLVCPVAEIT